MTNDRVEDAWFYLKSAYVHLTLSASYLFHDGGRYQIEMDWLLYDNGLRHERVKECLLIANKKESKIAGTILPSILFLNINLN